MEKLDYYKEPSTSDDVHVVGNKPEPINFALNSDGVEEDMVNHPSHYQSMDKEHNIECIDAMIAAFGRYEVAVFCKLNAFKYLWRASSKGGNMDINKTQWYLNKYKELGGEDQ